MMALEDEWVEQLYIDPEHQRRGHGARLLEVAQATRPALALWTFESNLGAQGFYEAHGFTGWVFRAPTTKNTPLPSVTDGGRLRVVAAGVASDRLCHLCGGAPTKVSIQRLALLGCVENGEVEPAISEVRLCEPHQFSGQPTSAVGGLDEQVQHVTALSLGWMCWVRRPVDRHQPDARDRLTAVGQDEPGIRVVIQAWLQPGTEVLRHDGKDFFRCARVLEHLHAVPANEIEVLRG